MESRDIAKRSCYKIHRRSLEIAQEFSIGSTTFQAWVQLFVLCSVWDYSNGHNYDAITMITGIIMGISVDSTGWLFYPLFPGRIGIWKCWFLWREENQSIRRKALGAGTRTNNILNPHMMPSTGIEPGPHWWKASALTTAPSLLP